MVGKSIAIIGTQYGDEGKAKIIDHLASGSDIVVRYQGGANAGHTVVFEDKKIILHQIPSGIIQGKTCIMGGGMVIDPVALKEEIRELERNGINDVWMNLKIDPSAHIILPEHINDSKSESGTGRGIAPCYGDKAKKRGLRFFDMLNIDKSLHKFDINARPYLEKYRDFLEKHLDLRRLVENTSVYLHNSRKAGKNILYEGAQAVGLDICHGQYPESTSSNPSIGGIFSGTGISHKDIDMVVGIAKAYITRVDKNGEGPLVTQIGGELEERIREAGGEFGATTGRPRRCGWNDSVLVNHAIRTCGMDRIVLTKLDILSGLPENKICIGYDYTPIPSEYRNVSGFYLPDAVTLRTASPVYMPLETWDEEINSAKSMEDLPKNARSHISKLQDLFGVPIDVSVGPDRDQTIIRTDYWK
jgi:adenylosuccinate synthase